MDRPSGIISRGMTKTTQGHAPTAPPLTWEDAVAIARELPKVEVSTWYNTPGLKVAGKGFGRLRSDEEGGLVLMCTLDDKARLLDSGDPAYFTTPHYDGYGAIIVDLARITPEALRERIAEAWRIKTMPRAKASLARRVCHHCKREIPEGMWHNCWTTTERELTKDLSEDLQDAWERLRETAAEFGEQRIYASHHSIMFARKSCYFFVRPKKTYLEVCVFLDRALKDARVRKVYETSHTKRANMLRIVHRDEVESPITDWLREAYDLSEMLSAKRRAPKAVKPRKKTAKPARKSAKPRKATSAKGPTRNAKKTTKTKAKTKRKK